MTAGQSVIFGVGLAFLVFLLAGDWGFGRIKNVSDKTTKAFGP